MTVRARRQVREVRVMSAEQYPAFCEFSEQSCSNPDRVRRCTRGFGCFCAATPAVQKDCSWRTEWLKEKGSISTRNTYDKLPDSQLRSASVDVFGCETLFKCLFRGGVGVWEKSMLFRSVFSELTGSWLPMLYFGGCLWREKS